MSLLEQLVERSGNLCELCGSNQDLSIYEVPPVANKGLDGCLYGCSICVEQIEDEGKTNANHWRCLNESMWSEHRAVQVIAWRMLSRMKSEGWPQDLIAMMYLDENTLKFAQATGEGIDEDERIIHKDINGVELQSGDSVVLVKDLKVKGSSIVAKQGTAVRRISLDQDNVEYIEGKVDGQQIVILTKYVKRI